MSETQFIDEMLKLGISITKNQIEQLNEYFHQLIDYNIHTNLTRITTKPEVYLKHYYDSAVVLKYRNFYKKSLIDLGSGAGFPGIVLKILSPTTNITLIDSSQKKIDFLNQIITNLKLKNIKALKIRSEEYNPKEKYDVVTVRAVAKLNILLEISTQLLKIDGELIAYKTDIEEEIKEGTRVGKILGYELLENNKFNLPYILDPRSIIIYKKAKNNNKFPRSYSSILKTPL